MINLIAKIIGPKILKQRFREMAFLNPSINLSLNDDREACVLQPPKEITNPIVKQNDDGEACVLQTPE